MFPIYLLTLRNTAYSDGLEDGSVARELRFAVGTPEAIHSTIWRIWGNKDDLYLAGRSFAGAAKISFHKSGICRVAQSSAQPRAPLASWTRPKRERAGAIGLFVIYVPAFEVKDAFREKLPPPEKKVELITQPPVGKKTIIHVVATETQYHGHFDFNGHDGKLTNVSYQVVGSINLTSEVVWVIAYEDDWREDEEKIARDTLDPIKAEKFSLERHSPVYFAMLHSYQTKTDPPGVTDYLLGPEYFNIPAPIDDRNN